MSDALIEKWRAAAEQVQQPVTSLPVPIDVLFGEAVDLVAYVRRYWDPILDGRGQVVRPGLSQVNAPQNERLPASIDTEIDELQQASRRAHTLYLLKSGGPGEDPMREASGLLADITGTLEFVLDDGSRSTEDQSLENLGRAHQAVTTQDGMALALEEYADLCDEVRPELEALGTFDARGIEQARALARQLRQRSAPADTTDEADRMKQLRDQLWTLLLDRMGRVRQVARHVYRLQPELYHRATSQYLRRQRAEARRREKSGAQARTNGGQITPAAYPGA